MTFCCCIIKLEQLCILKFIFNTQIIKKLHFNLYIMKNLNNDFNLIFISVTRYLCTLKSPKKQGLKNELHSHKCYSQRRN